MLFGTLAHLGERFHGMEEAKGSSPLGSTKCAYSFTEKSTARESMVTSGNGLDWMEKTPLSTGEKWVRIPLGTQHILLTLGWDERFISAST